LNANILSQHLIKKKINFCHWRSCFEMEKFIIRGYLNKDASKIGQYDFLAALTYQYKQDVKPENIFCAVSDNGDILGAVDLEPHMSWT